MIGGKSGKRLTCRHNLPFAAELHGHHASRRSGGCIGCAGGKARVKATAINMRIKRRHVRKGAERRRQIFTRRTEIGIVAAKVKQQHLQTQTPRKAPRTAPGEVRAAIAGGLSVVESSVISPLQVRVLSVSCLSRARQMSVGRNESGGRPEDRPPQQCYMPTD